MESEKQKSSVTITVGAVVGLIVIVLMVYVVNIWLGTGSSDVNEKVASAAQQKTEQPKPNTVASVWQWEETATSSDSLAPSGASISPDEDVPFSAEAIYEALQNVRIDENGDVVIDNSALEALNDTFNHGAVELSEQNLSLLEELIQIGLPGKAGEQTARIVVDYYHYLDARDEFNAMYAVDETADAERQYQELQALRQMYMGHDVADRLFAQADASARYMFNVRDIEADPGLSPEEKAAKLSELDEQLKADTIPVDNWRERYADFQTEKQSILEAGLSEQEKQAQVRALMRQHFQPEELERISYLELDAL